MKSRKHSSSFNKILIVVFGAAFGLVALALGYQAVKDSTDIRSRAAREGTVYRTWEFLRDAEGWKMSEGHKASLTNGSFQFTVGDPKNIPALSNSVVNTDIPQGKKYVVLYVASAGSPTTVPPGKSPPSGGGRVVRDSDVRLPVFGRPTSGAEGTVSTAPLVVGGDVACTADAKLCPDGSYVGRVPPTCAFAPCGNVVPPSPGGQEVTLLVSYKLARRGDVRSPLTYKAKLTSSYQRIPIAFPETLPEVGPVTIQSITIAFASGLRRGQTVRIDRIQLIGARGGNITPAPTCYFIGVKCDKEGNCPRVCVTPTPTQAPCKPRPTWVVGLPIIGGDVCPPTPTCTPHPKCLDNTQPCSVEPLPVGTTYCSPSPTLPPGRGGVVCPQDAKQCSDGSYVGRTGPNCTFECPVGPLPQ